MLCHVSIVHSVFVALECASSDVTTIPTTTPQPQDDTGVVTSPPDSANQQQGGVFSDSCVTESGIRFHVSADCRSYQMEWIGMGIRYSVQYAAPGTLFDVGICGINHESNVRCGSSGVGK